MNMTQILKDRLALSFEVFPPKTDAGMNRLCGEGGVLDHLYELKPDYISCTYGAGGTNVGKNLEVLTRVGASGRTVPVTHLTCIGNTREGLIGQLQTYLDNGIDHVLALRGDFPKGMDNTCGDLHYAVELVSLIRETFGNRFTIAVAGSPEGHIACTSIESDIGFLKRKQDEGADYIMTQLCWDMDQFRWWMDAIRSAGIWLPVDAGIMPVLDAAATINMTLSRNGCAIPRALAEVISKNWIFPNPFSPDEPEDVIAAKKAAFREAGMAYTVKLIEMYREAGVNGIHLYALNKYEDVTRLVKAAGLRDPDV
ncbi:MAG: methylenetetrahydrofolate reductase [Clostridia bacterium]|nr:methylenetetrahydrofolate reductase [Clostridia bacterium]